MMYKVLIVDDEKLARNAIKHLLSSFPQFDRIEEACDGKEAIEKAGELKPELIFLDIEMPVKNGIEVASLLGSSCHIVFVTAYNTYAVNAFDLNAIDYLLKPFSDERFFTAVNKVIHKLSIDSNKSVSQNSLQGHEISSLINFMSKEIKSVYKSKIVIKDTGRIRLINVSDIIYIKGAGNYADIYLTDGGHLLHRETLTSLESQLDPSLFIRIHRSTIVKKSEIIELSPNENGDYSLTIKNGTTLTLSRRNKNKLPLLLAE